MGSDDSNREVDVDDGLLSLCRQIGAGLENDLSLLPKEERDSSDAQKHLKFYVSRCRDNSDDSFQNDELYGGL